MCKMAATVGKSPTSLYDYSVNTVIKHFQILRKTCKILPTDVLFDVYYQLYHSGSLCVLASELCNLELFCRILRHTSRRLSLHRIFQGLEDHGASIGKVLTSSYVVTSNVTIKSEQSMSTRETVIQHGLRLGSFLYDAAWYDKAESIFQSCTDICCTLDTSLENTHLLLICTQNLLKAQSSFCSVTKAEESYQQCLKLVDHLKHQTDSLQLSSVYSDFSMYFLVKSQYNVSYQYSMEALQHLNTKLSVKATIEVLRQASKACVMKREFERAGILIRQAVDLAAQAFGIDHPVYGDALIDYGFFLLNFDCIRQSVTAYESAFSIKIRYFGQINIHVAIALEDLAYALYVFEYSSGRFTRAQAHAEHAIHLMEKLLPSDHIKLASAKRVKALILEEVAIILQDNRTLPAFYMPMSSDKELLVNAEQLHLSALTLSKKAFGEKNVQTAKHYGNLGRLYQSMGRYKEAEEMHWKSIAIKEELLGKFDYEVGLSVGHLASLYNYHMKEYEKARDLYLRSIDISIRLFGKGYSGLEYDYRGLYHVYRELEDFEKEIEYQCILDTWKTLKDQQLKIETYPVNTHQPPQPILDVVSQVLACPSNMTCTS